MNTHCNIAAIACDIVFKTLEGSAIVGVWWVNPANKQQVLHLGQYHVQQDVWCNPIAGGKQTWANDAACLQQRPAIALQAADLAVIRAKAQALFANVEAMAA